MLEERVMYLINAEIDGALEPGERAELDAILEASAEARTVRAELRKLATLLDGMPEQAPPADLADRILEQLSPPARRPAFSLADLFSKFEPVPAAAAFAAGLLAAVGFYEMSARENSASDLANMVGTMVTDRQAPAVASKDSLNISAPGVSGTVSLGVQGDVLVLNVVLESAQQTEILIALAEAGLGFGGIAHAAAGNAAEESYEVSGGALRVMNQGRQAYSVFLLQKAQRNDRGRQISIGVSSGGQAIYQGVLRG